MLARAVTRRPGVVRPTLAPAILALALAACGAGSPPSGDGDADSTAGPAPFEPIAGAAVDADAGSDAGTDGDVIASDPVGCDASPDAIRTRALELINAARAEARFCGEEAYRPAVDPLGWDARLEAAARAHSTDMATINFFDHTGSDGSSPGDRIAREGYDWRRYAENIAAGQTTLEAAVTGWLDSPGHCRNLMQADVSETAIACVADDGADYRRYWTQVFARPPSSRTRP